MNMRDLILGLAVLALNILPGALATPLKQVDPIAANTATCNVSFCSQGHGSAQTCYKVHVGRPFINGGGCPSIQDNIRTAVKYVGNYLCQDDGLGRTSLSFSTSADPTSNTATIDALQKSYPDVPFQAERICLTDGNAIPADWPPAATDGEEQTRSDAGGNEQSS